MINLTHVSQKKRCKNVGDRNTRTT